LPEDDRECKNIDLIDELIRKQRLDQVGAAFLLLIFMNIMVDISYAFLDPRIRYD